MTAADNKALAAIGSAAIDASWLIAFHWRSLWTDWLEVHKVLACCFLLLIGPEYAIGLSAGLLSFRVMVTVRDLKVLLAGIIEQVELLQDAAYLDELAKSSVPQRFKISRGHI